MDDILLRGFEMPTDASLWLLIRPDGTVHKLKVGGKHGEPQQGVAVPLPKGHGRIVDAAEVLEKAKNSPWFDGDIAELGLLLSSEVTAIIPEAIDDDLPPIKPEIRAVNGGIELLICPACCNILGNRVMSLAAHHSKRCERCGQAIDWTDWEPGRATGQDEGETK